MNHITSSSTNSGTLSIYTDGACLPTRFGSWSFVILNTDEVLVEQYDVANKTTSSRMELQAVIQSLKALPKNSSAILWTDSRVVLEIVQSKLVAWKQNGWLRSRGQQIIDLDLVQELDSLMAGHKIEWRWVRAHSGNKYNEHCDRLCRQALKND